MTDTKKRDGSDSLDELVRFNHPMSGLRLRALIDYLKIRAEYPEEYSSESVSDAEHDLGVLKKLGIYKPNS